MTRSTPLWRLALFAGGDFAFNLYWQSIMLYLLFYYSDALGLGIGTAATTYLVASLWDGLASFAIGIAADRSHAAARYRLALIGGAVPLGLAFVLAYSAPPVSGSAGVVWLLATHLVLRTAYAAVNVPYCAMSARISPLTRDRQLVAGLRMLFGSAAGVLVAEATVPLGRWLTGAATSATYAAAAALFAAIASVLLIVVGWSFRDAVPAERPLPSSVRQSLAALARNRAFVTLNAAMLAVTLAMTILPKSVLYYFKYVIGDEGAGQLALAVMMAISTAAVPLWMLISRRTGTRAIWLIAALMALGALLVFAALDIVAAGAMQLFLVVTQAATIGLHFAYWAMLPDTIEYGEHETGVRNEAVVFGVGALLQRIGVGTATAILGWGFWSAGYTANVAQSSGTLAGMRLTIAVVPIVFLALAAAIMLANPLRRGIHDRMVAEMEG